MAAFTTVTPGRFGSFGNAKMDMHMRLITTSLQTCLKFRVFTNYPSVSLLFILKPGFTQLCELGL